MPPNPCARARALLGESGYLDAFRARPEVDVPALLQRYGLRWDRWPVGRLPGALILFDAAYIVLTNSLLPLADQRLAAAHELGHYLMHRGRPQVFLYRPDGTGNLEQEAACFAAKLLMPTKTVRWLWRRGYRTPEKLGRVLGVSAGAAGMRIAELSLDAVREGEVS